MPKLNPEIESFARIKVIGIGGSGKNALNHMISSKVKGVEFIAMNTDTQDLHNSQAEKKVHLGKNLTKGLGAGMNPEVGRRAAEETKAEIQDVIKGADMIFIACGMGGGTGTGAAPIVAQAAREQGILTVAVVTKPFSFEGNQRMKLADLGLSDLEKEVDAILVIPNDRLIAISEKEVGFKEAFALCDEVLKQAVEGISELITTPGMINVDFADIKSVMYDAGSALMGVGIAAGEGRAEKAALSAINSPLLDLSISGARGVLFAISGGEDLTIHEIQQAAKIITESIDKDAKVIFGTIQDEKLKKGEMKVTVIATGFPTDMPKRSLFQINQKKEELESEDKKEDKEENSSQYIKKNDKNKEVEDDLFVDDTDEWSTVPAFLRRNKK
ncbi:MAG TPA: cell division protein FtsZ [Candidatus Paceibacterota bacterium]|nr:cell division protein FtsZ [Candidatus Paceibacterota bacterium]HPC12586.1 cell division protein FtsZ [Candidatus Paceibacterota bacterium]HQC45940.1 cell division protein FtsZ [Candidatus Paceibacterota bacterium]HQM18739.1 cell division protein FtsZ [Candidatus Paceibacterota bacterium]HQO71033.1 cell division protein FtsZ [Candidatus Paceibacterota bacterium]